MFQVLYGIFSVDKALLIETERQQRWRSHHNNASASNREVIFMWPRAVPQVLVDGSWVSTIHYVAPSAGI